MATPGLVQNTHVAYCGVRSPLASRTLRRAYEWVVREWERLGFSPEVLVAKGTEVEWPLRNFNFIKSRRRFEALDLAGLGSFGFETLIPGKDEQGYQYEKASFSIKRCWNETTVWNPFVGLWPVPLGISHEEAERHALELAGIVAGSYGYVVRRRGRPSSTLFWAGGVLSADFDPETRDDHARNIGCYRHEVQAQEVVLRDLFPINLLGRRFLDLRFGDTGHTLQEWIEQDVDARGTLAPLAGAEPVLVWRPPLERLPELRTELFRAGLLFYWKHFLRSQPEFRDFSKPFKPPREVPAIFRPEFYAGRDAGVTR
jgi:hypothetical protein